MMRFESWKSLIAFSFLAALGCFKVAAEIAGARNLGTLATMIQVSPAMKVFTAHDGYETFANRFTLTTHWPDGREHQVVLSPHNYDGLRGPYNRRNAYGAAVAYGPLLSADPRTKAMYQSVAEFAICNPGALLTELGINGPGAPAFLVIDIKPMNRITQQNLPYRLEVPCDGH